VTAVTRIVQYVSPSGVADQPPAQTELRPPMELRLPRRCLAKRFHQHRGNAAPWLFCQTLGLVFPKSGHCELRVGNERRARQKGKCLLFDDTTEHEAWNDSDEERIILLIDIKRDPTDSELEMPRHLEGLC
jgi:aspartyl/asparaginyl beta-hydroxylase (cupin superfamily)